MNFIPYYYYYITINIAFFRKKNFLANLFRIYLKISLINISNKCQLIIKANMRIR